VNIDLLEGYLGRSRASDTHRLINLYVEKKTVGSKSKAILVGSPGLELFTTMTTVVRGAEKMNGIYYVVSGSSLYEVDSLGVATSRGTLSTSNGKVSITNNGTQMLIVDGTSGYIYTGTTLTKITAAGFPNGATFAEFLDGFFIVNSPLTGQFNWSGAYDGLLWDGLDFATAEGSPDGLVRHFVDHEELWLFGSDTTEIWTNTGGADIPFERLQGAFIEIGCVAKNSVTRLDNTVVWLGQSGESGGASIFMAQGYNPKIISDENVDFAIDNYPTISDAVALSYNEEGHSFYAISFPSANATWVYDAVNEKWHERISSGGRWKPEMHTWIYGSHMVPDYATGKIYKIKHDVFKEDGAEIIRDLYTNHISNDEEYLFGRSIELVAERGGVSSIDPMAMLRISRDGGNNYGLERMTSLGKTGEFLMRAKWRRLGRSRDAVFHIRISSAINVVITKLVLR